MRRSGNYNGYCNPEIDKLIDQQSMEPDQDKRSRSSGRSSGAWPRTRARPIVYFNRGGTCWDRKSRA